MYEIIFKGVTSHLLGSFSLCHKPSYLLRLPSNVTYFMDGPIGLHRNSDVSSGFDTCRVLHHDSAGIWDCHSLINSRSNRVAYIIGYINWPLGTVLTLQNNYLPISVHLVRSLGLLSFKFQLIASLLTVD